MKRNARQDAINRLREQQSRTFSSDRMFDERFDRHFDKMESRFDKAFDNPVGFFAKFGILALVLNFLFWGGLLVLGFVLLNYFGVI